MQTCGIFVLFEVVMLVTLFSKLSKLIYLLQVVSEDGKKVRRLNPLPVVATTEAKVHFVIS